MPTLDDIPTLAKRSTLTGKDTIAVSDESSGGGSRIHKLSPALLGLGYTHGWEVRYDHATIAGQENESECSVVLMSLDNPTVIAKVTLIITELWTGTSWSSCTGAVGLNDDVDDYVTAMNIFTGATLPNLTDSNGSVLDFDNVGTQNTPILHTQDDKSLCFTVNPAGGDNDAATAGKVIVLASLIATSELSDAVELITS